MSGYDEQIRRAMAQNPLVRTAGEHVLWRTEAMRRVHQGLNLQARLEYDESKYQDLSGAALQERVVSYLDKELENIKAFDSARKASGALPLPEQVSTHRLGFILPKVRETVASEEDGSADFHRLAQGRFDPDPSFSVKWPMLRTNSYWGSNRATIESAQMLCFRFATSTDTIVTYAGTSIAHSVPTPNLPSCFQTSGSKFFANINVAGASVPSFGFPHGGFAFGGQRGEPIRFEYGPEDCSSIVHNWHDATEQKMSYRQSATLERDQLSTRDLLYLWRAKQKQGSYFIDQTPEASKWRQYLEPKMSSSVPVEEVKSGDIYLLRVFSKKDGDPDTHAKGGGHTGVVIGDDPENPANVLVFECGRDMESEDPSKNKWGCAGAGVGSFPKVYESEKDPERPDRIARTMFLRPGG